MEYINELMTGEISKEKFLKKNNIADIEDVIMRGLHNAYEIEDAEHTDIFIYLIFVYELYTEKYVSILNELLVCGWHYQHENIAMILKKIKSPASVEYLYREVLTQREYLAYNDNESKIVKCLWALGEIGTENALQKLSILAERKEQIIRKNAIQQMERAVKKDGDK